MAALLLGAELAVIDAEFYLVFLGIAAAVVGVLRVLGLSSVWWLDWIIFAGVSVFAMVMFRRRVYARLRGQGPPLDDPVVGHTIVVEQWLDEGQACRAEFRGTTWTVSNVGPTRIGPGQRVRIEATEGLTLKVRGD